MLEVCKIKTLSEQVITLYEGSDCVEDCYRNAVITDMDGSKCYDITLRGGDAFIPLKVGQKVLADLRWDSTKMDGVEYDHYYVMSIHPLEMNAKIEYVKDWTTHLV